MTLSSTMLLHPTKTSSSRIDAGVRSPSGWAPPRSATATGLPCPLIVRSPIQCAVLRSSSSWWRVQSPPLLAGRRQSGSPGNPDAGGSSGGSSGGGSGSREWREQQRLPRVELSEPGGRLSGDAPRVPAAHQSGRPDHPDPESRDRYLPERRERGAARGVRRAGDEQLLVGHGSLGVLRVGSDDLPR